MNRLRTIELVSAIHERVRRQSESRDPTEVLEEWSAELASLSSAYGDVYTSRNLVGRTPQMPSLLVAKIAGVVIWVMQKALFWHTPQIRRFQQSAATALGRLRSIAERDFEAHVALDRRIEELESAVRRLAPPDLRPERRSTNASEQATSEGESDLDRFCVALQARFQKSARADVERQAAYTSLIAALRPKAPEGSWVDVGCGTGEWLGRLRADGRTVVGLDVSQEAVQRCRDRGLDALRADALDYLSKVEPESLAAVTAFHVFEHWPFDYTLACVRAAFRALARDGVLIIETPNPANLLMAAEQFWMDPTHRRPLPLPLMEFLFEYCGFRVEHRLRLSPRPEEEHLPMRELELSARLDEMFYGPQDYAIVVRKP